MEETKITTESGTVAVAEPEKPAFDANDQRTWSRDEREHWNATGERPAPPTKADSATASTSEKKTKPEPTGKTSAESGAAPKQDKKERTDSDGKQTAEERIGQLTAQIKRLEEQISKNAAQKPEPAKETKPAEAPKRPNPFTWTGTQEEFDKAMDAYEAHRDQLTAQKIAQQRAWEEVQKRNEQMLKQAAEKYPDAKEKIISAATKLSDAQLPAVLKQFVDESDVVGDLLYALSDGETLAKLVETAKTEPGKAFRALADMERDIKAATKAKPDAKPENADVKTSPKSETPAKPEPKAPKPPVEVGGRGASTERADHAAARTGNFAAFSDEMARKYRAGA